jgi:hypothetical protein
VIQAIGSPDPPDRSLPKFFGCLGLEEDVAWP